MLQEQSARVCKRREVQGQKAHWYRQTSRAGENCTVVCKYSPVQWHQNTTCREAGGSSEVSEQHTANAVNSTCSRVLWNRAGEAYRSPQQHPLQDSGEQSSTEHRQCSTPEACSSRAVEKRVGEQPRRHGRTAAGPIRLHDRDAGTWQALPTAGVQARCSSPEL